MFAFIFGTLNPSLGQNLPQIQDAEYDFRQGIELLSQEKYSAAQHHFALFKERAYKNASVGISSNLLLLTEADFYQSLCDFHLLRGDAEEHLDDFIRQHPDHAKTSYAYFHLGKLFYIKRNFRAATQYLAAVEPSTLNNDLEAERKFMLGYSYYNINKPDEGAVILEPLITTGGIYRDKAAYYYGVMQFNRKKYDEALSSLQTIQDSSEYRAKVPIYITTILLEKHSYDQLDSYGLKLMDSKEPIEQKEAVFKQIGLALYEKGECTKAIPYFEENLENNNSPESGIFYRIGMCHFKNNEYDPAIFYFSKILGKNDATSQMASYYTAFSLMKKENWEEARLAFKRSYELKFDEEVKKDALMQYAKLSFETKYYNDALWALKTYVKDYPSADDISDARSLAGEALYYSSNFKDAIKVLESTGLQDKRSRLAYQKALYFYAVNLYSRNQIEEAGPIFKKSAEVTDGNSTLRLQSYFWQGEVAYALKKYDEAEQSYEKFLTSSGAKSNEYYPNVLIGLGWKTLLQQNEDQRAKYEKAKGYFHQAAKISHLKEDQPELYIEAALRTADCAFVMKEYSESEKMYQSVYDLKKNEADYALFQLGVSKLRQSKWEAAIDKFKLLDENFEHSEFKDEALLQISNTYLNWISDPKIALKYGQRLTEEHPQSEYIPKALLNCGFAAVQMEKKNEAILFFKTVLNEYGEKTEEAQVALDELASLSSATEINELVEKFKVHNPTTRVKTDNVLFKAGRDLYEIQNDPSGAVSQLTRYLSEAEGNPEMAAGLTHYYEALYIRALANYDLRFQEKSFADLQKIYDKNSDATADQKGKAYMKVAAIYADQKIYDKAVENYQNAAEVIENSLDLVQIHFAIGDIRYKLTNYEESKGWFQKVIDNPNTTEYSRARARVALGKSFFQLKDYNSAFEIFKDVELYNKNAFGAESQYYMAQILFDQKKNVECKTAVFYLKDNYPTQNYWKAKAFIILAEVFRLEKDYFQAVETMKSVADNSPDDDIKNEAKSRLTIFEKEADDPKMNPAGFELEPDENSNESILDDDHDPAIDEVSGEKNSENSENEEDLFDDTDVNAGTTKSEVKEAVKKEPKLESKSKPGGANTTTKPVLAQKKSQETEKANAKSTPAIDTKNQPAQKNSPKKETTNSLPKKPATDLKKEAVDKPSVENKKPEPKKTEPSRSGSSGKQYGTAAKLNNTFKPSDAASKSVTDKDKNGNPTKKETKADNKAEIKSESKSNPTPVAPKPKAIPKTVPPAKNKTVSDVKKDEKDLGKSEIPKHLLEKEKPKPVPTKKEETKPPVKMDQVKADAVKKTPSKEVKTPKETPKSTPKVADTKKTPPTKEVSKNEATGKKTIQKDNKSETPKKAEIKKVEPQKVNPAGTTSKKVEPKKEISSLKKDEPKKAPSNVAKPQTVYHIIVEEVVGKSKAETSAQKWKSKGFAIRILQGKGENAFRLSIFSSESESVAEKKLNEWIKSKKIENSAFVYQVTRK